METSALCEELRKLPMRDGVALELLALLDDPDVSAPKVAQVLGTDAVLSARCLHLANSPYFGLGGRVGSLPQAVVLLGFAVIRTLAVSTAAGLFVQTGRQMPEGFWDHSATVAAGASLLARHCGIPVGDAFSAGLLHDLGAALLFRHDPERYDVVLAAAGEDEGRRTVLERAVFGMDHAEAGAIVLREWNLPAWLVEAVAGHHADPETAREPITRVVWAGEAIAALMLHDDAAVLPRLEAVLTMAGVHDAPISTFVETLRAEVGRLEAFVLLGV